LSDQPEAHNSDSKTSEMRHDGPACGGAGAVLRDGGKQQGEITGSEQDPKQEEGKDMKRGVH
jgi:hypothetical protein